MSMKRLLLALVCFFLTVGVYAENVSRSEALKKAQQFMPGRQFVDGKAYARGDKDAANGPFYVFNAENNDGYVIVSGDDRTTEIIGYSKTGHLDLDQIPENLKYWLNGYARQIEALGTSTKPVQKAQTRGGKTWVAIDPLIKTKWDQSKPYNLRCPDANGRDWRDAGFNSKNICLTGCVATAMAQVMYYWRYPETCPAISGYQTDYYGWTVKALPATTFQWSQMKTTYQGKETDASATAVAELMRYCGQAVEMDYTVNGSNAAIDQNVLAEVFGYSKNIRLRYRDLYTTSQWEEMIYAELAAKRPVLYGGQTAGNAGHQFIVDGYDGSGLFHMNWGWGGMSDDYFVLSLADPDNQGSGGSATNEAFQFRQDALTGVEPSAQGEVLTPLMESWIFDLGTTKYTRSAVDDNFTNVSFKGAVFAYYNQPSTKDLKVYLGWALCQNGQIKQVIYKDSHTFEAGDDGGPVIKPKVTFGAGLALGKYEVCQVYRFTEDADWSLCAPYHETVFLVAEVTATTLTVRQALPSFKVNSIKTPKYPTPGNSMDVTVNVTNDGETFEQVVRLWSQKQGESSWTLVATATRRIDPGASEDVTMSFKPSVEGTYNLKVTDNTSDDALATHTVTVGGQKEITIEDMVNLILSGSYDANADMNNDGKVDATDIVLLVKKIMGK